MSRSSQSRKVSLIEALGLPHSPPLRVNGSGESMDRFKFYEMSLTSHGSLIAGGSIAIQNAVEGAEDSPEAGIKDLVRLSPPLVPEVDTVIGLAASGRTPYVLGALEYARGRGCFTAGICCVTPSAMRNVADVVIQCPVGPEVVTGSTRMKSGTATKMVSPSKTFILW